MFRGFPHIPTIPCKHCKGGFVKDGPWSKERFCTSCNGTGIAGDPGLGCLIVIGMALITFIIVAGAIYYGRG
ncbi:MAG: hypothetical protein CMK82_11225 [Pseudomonadales bacterium]|nr:hypothetical protein [Pseudomonadales bacterium]